MISRRALLASALPRSASLLALEVRGGQVLESERAEIAPAPPGSVVKPFVLAALEEAGIGGRLPCRTRLRDGTLVLDCVHGPLSVPPDGAEALAYSCNCWFAAMAARLKPGLLAEQLGRWGFGDVRRETGAALLALGVQGIRTTPLELARAYRRLALERARSKKLDAVFRGLAGAASYGTARMAAPAGLTVGGKTGTFGSAWFAGYAPEDEPRWVVVVCVEKGIGGSQAAPVARACFERLHSALR